MQIKSLIPVALLLALMFASCGSGRSSTDINPDSSAVVQARSIAAAMPPRQAAGLLISWMETATAAQGTFARELSRELVDAYADSSGLFVAAIDSIKDALPLSRQVHLFIVATRPARLGRLMNTDPDRDRLIPLIEEAYGTDTVALRAFRSALRNDSSIPHHN